MDDVADELRRCIEQACTDDTPMALAATRRARELLALLEGHMIDLARAEGVVWAAIRRGPWPGPPDAA